MERQLKVYYQVPVACLLCPNKLGQRDPDKEEETNEETSISLKNIFQYLGIDYASRMSMDSELSRMKGHDNPEELLAAGLCGDCSSFANLFGGVYQDFETARLLLIGCVKQFSERLQRGRTFPEEFGKGAADGDRWRTEILRHCHLKLGSTPKEDLDRAMREIATDMLDDDNNDSPMSGVTESNPGEVPNICKVEDQRENRPEEENISSALENATVSSFVPKLEDSDSRNDIDIESEVDSHKEVLQILDINQGLIRRLSDVVARQSAARKQESSQIIIKQDAPQITCSYCGVPSSTASGNQTHMMLVHTINYFSFPVGTTERDVTAVVSKLAKEGLSRVRVIGETTGGINCKFCGRVRNTCSMRFHILKDHADLVMSELSAHPLRSAPPPTNSTKSQLGKKIQIVRSSHQALLRRLRQNAGNGTSNSGVTKVKCQLCGKWCNSKFSLQAHKSKVHAGSGKAVQTKSKTCLYCGLTRRHSYQHVLNVHFFEHFESRLPPGTSKDSFKAAIQITAEVNLRGTHHVFDCRLCSRICSASTKRIHLLSMHFNAVLTTLKALTPRKY